MHPEALFAKLYSLLHALLALRRVERWCGHRWRRVRMRQLRPDDVFRLDGAQPSWPLKSPTSHPLELRTRVAGANLFDGTTFLAAPGFNLLRG